MKYTGLPNCVCYQPQVRAAKLEDIIQSLLNMSLYGVCSLILADESHTPIKYRSPSKKVTK